MSTSKTRGLKLRGALRSGGSKDHADARTERNKLDQVKQRSLRRAAFHDEREDRRVDVPVQHENLGLEFVLDRTGRDLSVGEARAMLDRLGVERAEYWADRKGDRAGERRKRGVARPLEYCAFCMAPWHSLAVVAAAAAGHRDEVLMHLKAAGVKVAAAIERLTGFEVGTVPYHPKQYASHFQPNWVKVSAAGELLGVRRGLGRSGKPVFLGPKLLGAWRLRGAGYDLSKYTFNGGPNASANLDKAIASRRAGGQEPLDLEVAKVLDAHFTTLERDPTLGRFFGEAREAYKSFKDEERLAMMTVEEVQAVNEGLKTDLEKERKQRSTWQLAARRLALEYQPRLPFIALTLRTLRDNPAGLTPQMSELLEVTQTGYKLRQVVADAVEVLATDKTLTEQCRVIRDLHDAVRGVVRGQHGPNVVQFQKAQQPEEKRRQLGPERV